MEWQERVHRRNRLLMNGLLLSREEPCGIFVCQHCRQEYPYPLPDWELKMSVTDYLLYVVEQCPRVMIAIKFCADCIADLHHSRDIQTVQSALLLEEEHPLEAYATTIKDAMHKYILRVPAILKAPCKNCWSIMCFLRDYEHSSALQDAYQLEKTENRAIIVLKEGKQPHWWKNDFYFVVVVNLEQK